MKRYFKVFSLIILTFLLGFNFVYKELMIVRAVPSSMVLEFDTTKSTGTTIILPIGTLAGETTCYIDWGDGNPMVHYTEPGLISYEYLVEGTYQVEISGIYDSFGYRGTIPSNLDACSKLVKVISFGGVENLDLSGAFYGAINLTEVPNEIPYQVSNLSRMFYNCSSFNSNISGWDVSSVTDISEMFYGATSFDQDLSSWDFSSITLNTGLTDAFYNTALGVDNYDALLNNLNSTATIPNNVDLDMGLNTKYSLVGNTSRVALSTKSWMITDGGIVSVNAKVVDASKTYGGSEPNYTIEYSGFITGHGIEEITGTPTFLRDIGENAGVYTVSVSGLTSSYYEINYQTGILTIEKASYDMSGVIWNYSESFVYDGTEKTVEVTNLPSGVSVNSYNNNQKTEAGNYIASVSFTYDTTNYNEPTFSNIIWTILKADYDMGNASWNYLVPYTYDGTMKSVTLVNLPSGVGVIDYFENEKTNPGEYIASVSLSYDSVNYNTPSIEQLNWVINAIQAAPTDVSGVIATSSSSNDARIINVSPLMEYKEENALNWISVEGIEINNLASGVYLVRFKEKDGFVASPSVSINLIRLTFNLEEGDDVIITGVENSVLMVNPIIDSDTIYKDINTLVKTNFNKNALTTLYQIGLTQGEDSYIPVSSANVRILIPLELRDNENLKLIHYQDGEVFEIDADRVGDYFEFETTSLGYYGMISPSASLSWIGIVAIILLLVISVFSTVFGYKYYSLKFKKK